jgi:hypothetical protein
MGNGYIGNICTVIHKLCIKYCCVCILRYTIQCVVIGSGIRGVRGITIEVLNTEQTPRSGDLIKHTCLTTPVTPHHIHIRIYLKVLSIKIIIKKTTLKLIYK